MYRYRMLRRHDWRWNALSLDAIRRSKPHNRIQAETKLSGHLMQDFESGEAALDSLTSYSRYYAASPSPTQASSRQTHPAIGKVNHQSKGRSIHQRSRQKHTKLIEMSLKRYRFYESKREHSTLSNESGSYNHSYFCTGIYCSLTNKAAIPIPDPIHMELQMILAPVLLAAARAVATCLEPVAPNG